VKTSSLILIAGFVLFQSAGAHAAGVCQTGYRYSFGDVAWDRARRQTLIICDDAPAAGPPLAPAQRFPVLSIRVSENQAKRANKEPAQRAPLGRNSETAVAEDRSRREQDPDAHITVLFRLQSSALSRAEKARLSSFIKSLDSETRAGNLFVTGYTCDLGNEAYNDVLAIERAEAVERYLRKSGLYALWLTGRGKCCYATEDPGKRYLNRRVEVTISKREGVK
jgi:outer membrane protein OmpA-like peptidoglycan-associated protein